MTPPASAAAVEFQSAVGGDSEAIAEVRIQCKYLFIFIIAIAFDT